MYIIPQRPLTLKYTIGASCQLRHSFLAECLVLQNSFQFWRLVDGPRYVGLDVSQISFFGDRYAWYLKMGRKGFCDLDLQCWLAQTYEPNWTISAFFESPNHIFQKVVENFPGTFD
jgi:hypothetical protein